MSLLASVITYRLSPFHPLARFPGPWQARITRMWGIKAIIGKQQHRHSHELFLKYGDVVRTGPDHLLFRDPDAISVVLGPTNPWPKGARYEVAKKDGVFSSVLSTTDPVEHGRRRRVWDLAFTPSSLKSYQPMLQKRVDQLISSLSDRVGQRINLADWLTFMALDFMGDFAYGGMFDFMRNGDPDGFRYVSGTFVRGAEILSCMPWIKPILLAFQTSGTGPMLKVAREVVRMRKEKGAVHGSKDLFYFLLDEDGQSGHPPMPVDQLVMESLLAIAAGSDTVNTVMANAVFYLIEHPLVLARLRKELDAATVGEGDGRTTTFDMDLEETMLEDLPYLDAIIHETLRLQPAIPNGVQRIPPNNGQPVIVAGHLVGPGTTCQVPTWSLHRDPRHFAPRPEEFWPERWLPEGRKMAQVEGKDYRLNLKAYMPFNYGPGICPGRVLAMWQMRAILAAIVCRFNVRYAEGFQAEDWTNGLHDQYVLSSGELPVIVEKR